MGIRQAGNGGGGVTFIDIKGKPQPFTDANGNERVGALVMAPTEKGGEKTVLSSFTEISGVIAEAEVKVHQYEGEDIASLKVKLVEEGERPVILTATLGSFLGAKFAGLVRAALEKPGAPIVFTAGYMQEGEKLPGGKTVEKGGTWIKVMQDGVRLAPLYAGGATELPEAPTVKVSGKTMKDMTPVNEVVGATIQEIYDALGVAENEVHGEDDGLSPADVAAAAQQAGGERQAMRARA